MKKILKYIFFFAILFGLSFINDLDAADDDYLFYCDYKIPSYDNLTKKSVQISLRAYVYDTKTAKFFNIDNDPATEILYKTVQGGIVTSSHAFDIDKYYTEATKDGKYTCPNIYAELSTTNLHGYVSGHYNLTFDSNSAGSGANKYISSGLKMNPKLEGTQKGEEIDNNATKITHKCTGKSLIVNKENGLRYNVEITLYMNSLGEKYTKVKYGIYEGEAKYDSVNGSNVSVVVGTYPTAYGSIPISDTFKFYGKDNGIMFNQNSIQIQNNTFTCPTVLPSVGIDKTSISNGASGSLSSAGGTIYTVAYSKEVMKEYGKDGTFHETTDAPLEDLMSSNNQIVSSNRGTCEFYLGSVNDEDSIAKFLDQVYTLIKIASIIIVIVITMIDLVGTVTGNKDNLTEVLTKGVKRLVILVIILLLPTFIDIIGSVFGYDGILCGIK